MMKFLSLFVLTFTFNAFAMNDCSFIRHHYVEVEGKNVLKELRNKILNEFNPDKLIVLKINEELSVKLCATFRPFHHLKDIPLVNAPKEERLLTKVTLTPDKSGFWTMNLENFVRKNEKEIAAVTAVATYTSAKSIKDIKDSEVVEWVSGKLIVLTK